MPPSVGHNGTVNHTEPLKRAYVDYLMPSPANLDENSKNPLSKSTNTGEEVLFWPTFFEKLKSHAKMSMPTPLPHLFKEGKWLMWRVVKVSVNQDCHHSAKESSGFSILWERENIHGLYGNMKLVKPGPCLSRRPCNNLISSSLRQSCQTIPDVFTENCMFSQKW